MPPILTYTLVVFLAVLLSFLVPLLFQMQRTAASAERFLDGARADLSHIQQDIHATRLRVDSLTTTAQGAMDQLLDVTRGFADLGASLKGSLDHLVQRLPGAGFNLGSLLGTLTPLLALFRRRSQPAE